MNGRAHRFGGAVAGGAAACVTRKGHNGIEIMVEVLAGAGGGMVGAKFPDWIEPCQSFLASRTTA